MTLSTKFIKIILLLFLIYLVYFYTLASLWELLLVEVPEDIGLFGKSLVALLQYMELGRGLFDDAFMFVRYSDNFLQGNGFKWNKEDDFFYGCTSLFYLFLVTVFRWALASLDIENILRLSAYSLGTLAIFLVPFIVKEIKERITPTDFLLALLFSLLYYIFIADIVYFNRIGMDTTASLFLNSLLCLSVLIYVNKSSVKTSLFMACCAYAAWMVRPDNLIFAVLCPGMAIFYIKRFRFSKDFIIFVSILGFLLLVDFSIKFLIYGDVLPVSHYVKTKSFYDGYLGHYKWVPIQYLSNVISWVMIFIPVIILKSNKKTLPILAIFLVPVLLTFSYYQNVLQIMGFNSRYYFPSLPFILCAVIYVWFRGNSLKEINIVRLVSTILVLSVSFLTVQRLDEKVAEIDMQGREDRVYGYEPERKMNFLNEERKKLYHQDTFRNVSEMMSDMPEGVILSASEVGRVAAFNPHIQVIDTVGLQNIVFAKEGFSIEFLLSLEPDIVWMPHFDYSRIRADIYDSENFWRDYQVYPELYRYGIAIRKKSPYFLEIVRAFKKSVSRHYEIEIIERYQAI